MIMKNQEQPAENDEVKNDPPPFLKSWKQLYAIVIGELVILIVLFYWITKFFS